MRGTDVPDEEIKLAEKFLAMTRNLPPENSTIDRTQLVRLLAWYGAIRSNGDRSGNFVVNGEVKP